MQRSTSRDLIEIEHQLVLVEAGETRQPEGAHFFSLFPNTAAQESVMKTYSDYMLALGMLITGSINMRRE